MAIKTEIRLTVPSGDVIGQIVTQVMESYGGKRITNELMEQLENDIFYAMQNCMVCSVSVNFDPSTEDNITDVQTINLELGDK